MPMQFLHHLQMMYPFNSFLLVHPCDLGDNAGCAQFCKKKGDDFTCTCKIGYILHPDSKSCNKSKYLEAVFNVR